MSGSDSQDERRGEIRRSAPTERISWVGDNATKTNAGWVNDLAESSMAFVTPTRDLPSPGDNIEVTFGTDGPSALRQSVLVVRTAPYDRFFSMVACQGAPAQQQA